MKSSLFLFICVLFSLPISGTFGQSHWQFEFMPGIGKALPSPVVISQTGYEDLNFWATFKTKSLRLPIYYSYRLSRYGPSAGWEIEMNHLKLYMQNRPDEVESFSITHGCNHLWVNRALLRGDWIVKFGGGIVIAHPENTVREKKLDESKGILGSGYYISGPSVHGGLQRNIPLGTHFFIPVEVKLSFSYVDVPVVDGRAKLPVVGLHFLTGAGVRIKNI